MCCHRITGKPRKAREKRGPFSPQPLLNTNQARLGEFLAFQTCGSSWPDARGECSAAVNGVLALHPRRMGGCFRTLSDTCIGIALVSEKNGNVDQRRANKATATVFAMWVDVLCLHHLSTPFPAHWSSLFCRCQPRRITATSSESDEPAFHGCCCAR